MISKLEKTILYNMAEAIINNIDNVHERIIWGNELLRMIDSSSN